VHTYAGVDCGFKAVWLVGSTGNTYLFFDLATEALAGWVDYGQAASSELPDASVEARQ
jgi:hypothetical protein